MGKRAKKAFELITWLYSSPIINPKNIAFNLRISSQSANSLARTLEAAGILREMTGYKRNRLYIFQQYVDILYSAALRINQDAKF